MQPYGKTQGAKMGTRGAIRHKDPLLDVQSAIGRYFVMRFTIAGEPFPDPCSKEFLTAKIWPGKGGASNALSYQAHYARFKKIYEACGIMIGKATHAPRYAAARQADDAGLAEDVSAHGLVLQ